MSTSTLALDVVGGDLTIENKTTGRTLKILSGNEAIAQHLRMRLRLIRTEWFLDEDAGMDYFGGIWKKGATDSQISAEIKATILGTAGVTTITDFALVRDSVSRTATFTFTALLDDGQVLVMTEAWS